MTPELLAAIQRLESVWNGQVYNEITNPGGMAGGGHKTPGVVGGTPNFVAALNDVAVVGDHIAGTLDAAAGTADDLATRLDVSLNPDGTLKYAAGSTEWFEEDAVPTRVTARQFTLPVDRSQIFLKDRRVRFNGTVVGFVAADATYAGGTTTVNVWGCDIPVTITSLQYGQSPQAEPAVPVDTYFDALEMTSATYDDEGKITRMDFATGHKVLFSYSGTDLDSVEYYDFDATTLIATNSFTYDADGNIVAESWS